MDLVFVTTLSRHNLSRRTCAFILLFTRCNVNVIWWFCLKFIVYFIMIKLLIIINT